MKRLIMLAAIMLLSACGDTVYPEHIDKATFLCATFEGVAKIVYTNTDQYPSHISRHVKVYCKAGEVIDYSWDAK